MRNTGLIAVVAVRDGVTLPAAVSYLWARLFPAAGSTLSPYLGAEDMLLFDSTDNSAFPTGWRDVNDFINPAANPHTATSGAIKAPRK